MADPRIPLTFEAGGILYGFWGVDRLYKADIAQACGLTRATPEDMAGTTQQRGDLPCHEVRASAMRVEGTVTRRKSFTLKVAPTAADTVFGNLAGKVILDRDDASWTIHRVRPKNN
jgi:hypothetical protein